MVNDGISSVNGKCSWEYDEYILDFVSIFGEITGDSSSEVLWSMLSCSSVVVLMLWLGDECFNFFNNLNLARPTVTLVTNLVGDLFSVFVGVNFTPFVGFFNMGASGSVLEDSSTSSKSDNLLWSADCAPKLWSFWSPGEFFKIGVIFVVEFFRLFDAGGVFKKALGSKLVGSSLTICSSSSSNTC